VHPGAAAPQGAVFSHMARPSRTPTVRDVDASPAKDAAGGAAEASAGGGQQSCYSFSEGDVVEVSWGRKRTKHDATVLAIDDSKKKQPVHVQFGANGNAWVSAASVVKRTDGAVAPPGTPGGLDARLAAAGGLAARADLIYKTSQHSKSNEAVAPANGATGLLAGGVGGVKVKVATQKPPGCEARLQGGVKSVFKACCGMCGKVGSKSRELRECRWTPPAHAGCTLNSLIAWQALREKSAQ
jgi:hypothetical protein